MVPTAFLVMAADLFSPVVPLDTMTVDHARTLSGHRVRLSMRSAKPADYHGGRTVVGCADRPDGVERGAILKGERSDVEKADLLLVGVLHVIDHPARVSDGAFIPAWVEIRVEE
jgi:hypothetical protein